MDRLIAEIIGDSTPPINPILIATDEKITLEFLPNVDSKFGRIECHREFGKFQIFCSESVSFDPVARFSLCHELGHYFLDEHRKLLLGGKYHFSNSGFICDSLIEKEADQFASRMLIPATTIKSSLGNKQHLDLDKIRELSSFCQTSLTTAAIRYSMADIEPTAVIISESGKVKFYYPSESASNGGFSWLGGYWRVPMNSATEEATKAGYTGKILERAGISEEWFSRRFRTAKIWEEAFALGHTGLVLTLLFFDLEDGKRNGCFLPSEKYYS